MPITKTDFGTTTKGEQASLYTITNANGNSVSITDFGAAIQSIKLNSKSGKVYDVVLGYDDVKDYELNPGCLGATVGRVAGRISNASFNIDGTDYPLYVNFADKHTLHGGKTGFDKKIFSAQIFENNNAVSFSLFSPDMEEGFPGNLNLSVIFTFDDYDRLFINYLAKSDKDTVLNLTNHSYFNLNGHDSGTVLDHEFQLFSDRFIETDDVLIPTGKFIPVENTPMDFRENKKLSDQFYADYRPLRIQHGYDTAFAVDKQLEDSEIRNVAVLYSPASEIRMYVTSSYPAVVVYTANWMNDTKGKSGVTYPDNCAICLEAQFLPDAINRPEFESTLLKAGVMYNYTTSFEFETGTEELTEDTLF